MGTICLGLLIAIGLEQTVEWVHHRRERTELREAMNRDLEQTLSASETTYESTRQSSDWLGERITDAQTSLEKHTPLPAGPLPFRGGSIAGFGDPSFRAAQASGLLVLLSQDEVHAFASMDDEAALMNRQMALVSREAHGMANALLHGERDLRKLEQAEMDPMPTSASGR